MYAIAYNVVCPAVFPARRIRRTMPRMDDFGTATDGWSDEALEVLAHVAALARTVVPEAVAGVSYGAPALLVDGKALVGVSRGAKHLALVPFSPPAIDTVRADLDGFAASKGLIRFTPEQPVPDAIVLRLVRARLAEIRPA
jgi:uncharacterized protein YdhG (YjbR/CyaY superfamily)